MSAERLRIARLDSTEPDFAARLEALAAACLEPGAGREDEVRRILEDVRSRGDPAVLEYARRFDGARAERLGDLELERARLASALAELPAAERAALEGAAARIRAYHERERLESWSFREPDGTVLGQRVTALERVGVYVPGGKAAYPSSVLMNAVPARVAGVGEIVMVTPEPSTLVLAAAAIAGVDRLFALGGAHAVAALAYGTASLPRVDKIVGPGNVYVATAKRLVFGVVGIDMVAGPSEVVIVADGSASPEWMAADLFAQAEHDEDARAILIAPDARYLDRVESELRARLPAMSRADIIARAIGSGGALVRVRDLDEACTVVNALAPEHLELAVAEPERLLARVRHAGAVFLGRWSAEVLGDYCAGPNHVLPTARTARFSSPLGVYDFQKRSSIIHCSPAGARAMAPLAAALARGEGLTAHARSAELRCEEDEER